NFSLELAGYNASFQKAITNGHQKFIDKIAPCVKEAQEKGELIDHIKSWELTFLIHSSFDGVTVKMKGTGSDDALKLFLHNFFKLIKK
ncbi:MAG: TetR family transcriptional regulator C-terminal domain-containing protein, partial [Bacteroidota bacterium]